MLSVFSYGDWLPAWLHPESMLVGALIGIVATLYLQLFQRSSSANVDGNGAEQWRRNSWQFQDARWQPHNMDWKWKHWQHQLGEGDGDDDVEPYDTTMPNLSHSDIPALLGMPTLPASLPLRALPALPSCPAAPLPCTTLFHPAAAEWAKPSRSAAATAGRPQGV